MFEEILECVLEFIGSHSEEHGCSGVELLSFLSTDVLPYYGLIDHVTLRQMVLGLFASENVNINVKQGGKPVALSELNNESVQYDQYTFHPTLLLQEKTLGISLSSSKNIRLAINYICDNFLMGISRFLKSGSGGGGGKNGRHLPSSGLGIAIRRLLREQWLRVLYVYEPNTMPLVPYLFPHFAVLPPCNHTTHRLRPLEAYLERRRKELWPHRVAIDPNVVRRVVLSSPEQRLLFEDAAHAIFAAHGQGVQAGEGRKMRLALRRMLTAAELRVVVALITVKHRTHRVRVVVAKRGSIASNGQDDENHDDDADDDDTDEDEDGACEGSDDDVNVSSDDDDDDDDEDGCGNTTTAGEEAGQRNGDLLFGVDPSYPLALQVVKEAERRPLAVESVLPRVILYDMRSTVNELHRFSRQFEERWGTIESTNVLSRHSKAFTRLLRPKGWDNERYNGTSNNNEEGDASLPKGVSKWSVNIVMEALRAAPLRALPLVELSRIITRRTLGRLIPYLRSEGLVATTGLTTTNGKRIGVLTLAGVELTAETRATLLQTYLNDLSEREQKRQQSTVVLQRLPEPAEGGVGHSVTAAVIARSTARSARVVAKVTMIRNGYSRVGLFRLSRLHLELWRVWCVLGQAPDTPMTLEQLLQEMSLSSFCIIVGVADVDVSSYVGQKTSPSCAWGTPICRLPPSLQEHCRRSGVQPLLHSLYGLQSHGLVVSGQSLAAYLDLPLAEVFVALVPNAQDEHKQNHVFYDGETMTSQDTCYAVLKFWSKSWVAVTPMHESHRAVGLIKEVISTEPNLTNVQLIALSRLLRMDSGILAEHILQKQGMIRVRKRTLCEAMQVDDHKRSSYVTHTGIPKRRIEVNGVTMAEALEAIPHSSDPCRALTCLQAILRRQHKVQHFSSYNPYSSRVYSSMQTLLQSILSVIKSRGTGGSLSVHTIMASVVSPNFAVTPDSPVRGTGGAEFEPAGTITSNDGCSDDTHYEEPSEALQDVLRMILLSDEAHYDAVAAKALLVQFPEVEQRRCIDWLLKFPSFRGRSGGSGRLPRIELSPILTFLPATLVSKITHPRSATATFVQDIVTSLLFTPSSNCRRWCVPPVALAEDAVGKDLLRRAPRLVKQPLMDLDSLVEEIRKQNGLGLLRLPRFAWPPRLSEASKVSSSTTEATNMASRIEGLSRTASKKDADEPYPARGLLHPWQRLRHLELRDIPVDGPPSAEQVARARSAVAALKEGSPSPQYPSIFHHVDGAFHEFVWRSFLFAVYSLVYYTPGITEDQIELRLKASGLVSSASCHVALEFLKGSLVIVARRVMVLHDKEVQSPFSTSGTTCQYRECYFCTVLQGGPWSIMDL